MKNVVLTTCQAHWACDRCGCSYEECECSDNNINGEVFNILNR